MPVTVSPKNYAQISSCDVTTGWVGNSLGTESDFLKEGAGCLGFTIRTIGNNDMTYTPGGYIPLAGIKHLRVWFLCSTPNSVNVEASGGVQFFVSDGTNTGYYYVCGKDTYPGGWYNLVVDLSRTVDFGTKPSNMDQVTSVGIRMNMTAAPKNVDNVWIDNLIRCDGLICYGDDAGSPFDLQDIYDKDNALSGAWGVIRKIGGIFYLTGNFTFGDDPGANSCDFKEISQIASFENRKVNADLYNITVVGNGTGTTKFQLGNKPVAAGIQGCTIKSEGVAKFDVICTDPDVSDFKLYGCTFVDADTISLPTSGANREVISCNFESCGEILTSTCKVQYCKVIAADDRGMRLNDDTHDVTLCDFINCPHGVNIPYNGDITIEFDALKFSGCTKDIEKSGASGVLTVQNKNQSNASTYDITGGGSVSIITSATHTLTGMKQNTEVTYVEVGTGNVLFNVEDVDETGETNFNYDATVEKTVDIHIHHINYVPILIKNLTLTSAGGKIPVTQYIDRVYSNP